MFSGSSNNSSNINNGSNNNCNNSNTPNNGDNSNNHSGANALTLPTAQQPPPSQLHALQTPPQLQSLPPINLSTQSHPLSQQPSIANTLIVENPYVDIDRNYAHYGVLGMNPTTGYSLQYYGHPSFTAHPPEAYRNINIPTGTGQNPNPSNVNVNITHQSLMESQLRETREENERLKRQLFEVMAEKRDLYEKYSQRESELLAMISTLEQQKQCLSVQLNQLGAAAASDMVTAALRITANLRDLIQKQPKYNSPIRLPLLHELLQNVSGKAACQVLNITESQYYRAKHVNPSILLTTTRSFEKHLLECATDDATDADKEPRNSPQASPTQQEQIQNQLPTPAPVQSRWL